MSRFTRWFTSFFHEDYELLRLNAEIDHRDGLIEDKDQKYAELQESYGNLNRRLTIALDTIKNNEQHIAMLTHQMDSRAAEMENQIADLKRQVDYFSGRFTGTQVYGTAPKVEQEPQPDMEPIGSMTGRQLREELTEGFKQLAMQKLAAMQKAEGADEEEFRPETFTSGN